MKQKLAFLVATAVVYGALPQLAHASCSGNACSAFSFANNKFTNKDKDRKIHLTGCIIKSAGACGSPPAGFDVTVDPNSSKSITVPASLGPDVKVDVKTAAFIGEAPPPHVQPAAKDQGCQLSMDKENCETRKNLKEAEDARKRRDQARTDLAKARDEHDSCVKTASLNPIKIAILDVCAASQEKINSLQAEISKDDKILGETEPGAPVRTQTVLDTKPIPAKPAKDPKDKIPKPHGCTPGKVDALDGRAGGCTFDTNLGGGKK